MTGILSVLYTSLWVIVVLAILRSIYLRLPRLYQYIVRNYLGPFAITFFICLFILLMQFLWKYVDDLMGKGLEWYLIAELLFYASANLVPMALPLAILLSSIMTFGNLGERSELIAMKSAGMGLFRIMLPLIVFIVINGISAFFFSNNLWPVANLKFKSLLFSITEKKPTFNIKPGAFYSEIPGYSIRVKGKDPDTEELSDILIYDHTNRYAANSKVIHAKRGTMQKSAENKFLILTLEDGIIYEEHYIPVAKRKNTFHPHIENAFKKQIIRIDMSELAFVKAKEDLFSQDFEMLNIQQLVEAEDSIKVCKEKRMDDLTAFMARALYLRRDSNEVNMDTVKSTKDYLNALNFSDRSRILELAVKHARNTKRFVEKNVVEHLENQDYLINRYRIEWHRKFTLSFACIILFFIGAPLGAIIRKGGLGMPVVFSVLLFLVFHILSLIGEKMVKSEVVEPWAGMWLGSAILFPFGLLITYAAAIDSKVLSREGWKKVIATAGFPFAWVLGWFSKNKAA